jgi:exodeoxyribonuclease VIII
MIDTPVVPHKAGKREWLGRFTAKELTNDAYHEAPGVSKSHLDVIASSSAKHYWAQYVDPLRVTAEKTPALRVGNAIHSAILEPDLFASKYFPKPECDRRTIDGKAIYANYLREKGDREEISPKEYDCCIQIRDAVYAHKIAPGLLSKGTNEHSFFCHEPETGELIKCRTDYFHDDGEIVVDLKSTLNAAPWEFGRDATNYRYDVAVPWYFDVIHGVTGQRPRNWVWLAVEKEPPYAIGIYYAQKQDIMRARDTARRNFLEIVRQRKLATWDDYGAAEVRPLELMPWVKR